MVYENLDDLLKALCNTRAELERACKVRSISTIRMTGGTIIRLGYNDVRSQQASVIQGEHFAALCNAMIVTDCSTEAQAEAELRRMIVRRDAEAGSAVVLLREIRDLLKEQKK